MTARGFSYRYPTTESWALHDVSLELEPGSFTVVAGRSGSGKSTLIRAACGLVPHFHGGEAAGELTVGGLDVREHGPRELAQFVGAVFQEPESQVVMSGVRAEIALALEYRGESQAGVARSVEEVALALGIGELLDRRTDTLSGGELQRVAVAAALAHRPALIVLDEPTSQLDPVAGDELIWLLRRLNEEWGTTVLVAEHRLERCLPAADRVIAFAEGRVACDAAPREFLDWATRTDVALATPAARLFSLAGIGPLPTSVRDARRALEGTGLARAGAGGQPDPTTRPKTAAKPALDVRGAWLELDDGPVILRDISLRVRPGERVALMGRNGAGKSTLLRVARGLVEPTRGTVERGGEVALLLQSPGAYLIHEHAGDEADDSGLQRAGLSGRGASNPRDLSGGERQRLALEAALGATRPAVACLDEPTRGMDRAWKDALVERIGELAAGGTAVVVATHDTEFAARFADRIVLMGKAEVLVDAPAAEVLAGGWQFSTDTARILGPGAGALTPEQGAAALGRELVG